MTTAIVALVLDVVRIEPRLDQHDDDATATAAGLVKDLRRKPNGELPKVRRCLASDY